MLWKLINHNIANRVHDVLSHFSNDENFICTYLAKCHNVLFKYMWKAFLELLFFLLFNKYSIEYMEGGYQYNLMASTNLTVILFLDFHQFPSQPFFWNSFNFFQRLLYSNDYYTTKAPFWSIFSTFLNKDLGINILLFQLFTS